MTQLDAYPSQICQPILALADNSMACSSQPSQVECSQAIPRMRSVYKGPRVVGGRLYDSMLGVTCHWCRQKTVEDHVRCCRCPVAFCGQCLKNRHAEFISLEIQPGVNWLCPKCRGGCGEGCDHCCNCGPCRKSRGLGPTGLLIRTARACGFTNVHDFLVHQQTGESPEAISLRKKGKGWCRSSEVSPEELQIASQVLRPVPCISQQNSQTQSLVATQIHTQTSIAGTIKLGHTSSFLYNKTNQQSASTQATVNFRSKKNLVRPKPEPDAHQHIIPNSLPIFNEPTLDICSQQKQSRVKDEPSTAVPCVDDTNMQRVKKVRKTPKVPRRRSEKSASRTCNSVSDPSSGKSTSDILTSAPLPAIVKKELITGIESLENSQCTVENPNQHLSLSRPVKEETKDVEISSIRNENAENSSYIASSTNSEYCGVVVNEDVSNDNQNGNPIASAVHKNQVPGSTSMRATVFSHISHLWKADDYKSKLQQKLSEPFNTEELITLSTSICHKSVTPNHSKTTQGGLSYLDHHPDFASKLSECKDLNSLLTLLRGFYFWLEHAGTHGSYKPWACLQKVSDNESDDCVVVDGPDCEILAVVCTLDDD